MTPTLLQCLERLLHGDRILRAETPAGLWAELRSLGIPLADGPSQALGFDAGFERLDAAEIRAHGLPAAIGVECRPWVESTNAALVANFQHRHSLLAECQSGGRGRNGRRWLSPCGGGLWFSHAYGFGIAVDRLAPLTLAVGVAVAGVLELPQLRLKWPNDLVVEQKKLGGILVEARSSVEGAEAVIGVGINLRAGFEGIATPDQPWTDLERLTGHPTARNRLAGRLIGAIDTTCMRFETDGFAPFLADWQRLDGLVGREVRVERGSESVLFGRAEGVGVDGLLRVVDQRGVQHRIASGEVRVRGL